MKRYEHENYKQIIALLFILEHFPLGKIKPNTFYFTIQFHNSSYFYDDSSNSYKLIESQ